MKWIYSSHYLDFWTNTFQTWHLSRLKRKLRIKCNYIQNKEHYIIEKHTKPTHANYSEAFEERDTKQ